MRLVMLAPLIEPVPPPLYGGSERVVSVLTEEHVRRGHEVTLFASGDSQTSATLVATHPVGLRLDPEVRDYVAATLVHVGEVYRQAACSGVLRRNHCARSARYSPAVHVGGRRRRFASPTAAQQG
jgi:hypothetical protein